MGKSRTFTDLPPLVATTLLWLSLLLTPAAVTAATYDVQSLGVPRFVSTNYIDVAKIFAISKFRSASGHNYSDDFEYCSSMKHYLADSTAKCITVQAASAANSSCISAAGVLNPSAFLGRSFNCSTDSLTAASLTCLKSVFFGKSWRNNPFVFSFNPRSHE